MREKVVLAWSGGKDSAIALYAIQGSQEYEVVALLTTVTKNYGRISMHGVRRILLERQAQSVNLPLKEVLISENCSNEEYESKMAGVLTEFRKAGVSSVVFGDIYLEDIRKYREEKLSGVGMKGLFPLWKRDSAELARTFLDSGFKAIVTCVDSKVLDKSFAGRVIDEHFLDELPANVDPMGENGEFHSFIFDGPIFKERITFTIGEVVQRDSFYFCDLLSL